MVLIIFAQAGETHPEVINFGREKLVCDTWPSIVHLQRLRNVLSTGLNSHLKVFTFLFFFQPSSASSSCMTLALSSLF